MSSRHWSNDPPPRPEPVDGQRVPRRIFSPFDQHETFRALGTDARLLDKVESLIGPDFHLQHSKLNMKPARVGSVVEWHQEGDALVGGRGQDPDVGALAVADQGDRQLVNARVARQGTRGELGKLAVVASRQGLVDLADVLLNDVEVVEQPLPRGSYVDAAAGTVG